jgi:hypothetical protein
MLRGNTEIMNAHRTNHRVSGFNLIELLIIIGVIAFFAFVLLPVLAAAHKKQGRINCVSHLLEISKILRREGSPDPMGAILTNSETMKQVTNGSAYLLWQSLSNRLSSPDRLHCPDDRRREAAQSFFQGFSDANISYFFSLDAPPTDPQMILAGDRNVWVDGSAAKPGLVIVSSNSVVGWTRTELHRGVGNLLMADGSSRQVTSNLLQMAFTEGFNASTNITSARLVIP